MGILSWLGLQRESEFCRTDFKDIWSGFVDSFVDTIHADGPAGKPPETSELPKLPTVLPKVPRLVAVGDLHGDIEKTKRAFRIAGLIDEAGRWSGGKTVCVQVGDQLDRGDHEVSILYFLERLQQEAEAAGGALYVMNGNHETMNVGGRFRYATPGAIQSFQQWRAAQELGAQLKGKCKCQQGWSAAGADELPPGTPANAWVDSAVRARYAAMRPGGPLTMRFFARHPTVLQVGSTVFVHGGLLPQHVEAAHESMQRINDDTQRWMSGDILRSPNFLLGRHAVVWAREYSARDEAQCDCDMLKDALLKIPEAERMVVGHTIQTEGVNGACDNQVLRVDVGMSWGCGNHEPEVLEIRNDKDVYRLREGQPPLPMQEEVKPAPSALTSFIKEFSDQIGGVMERKQKMP